MKKRIMYITFLIVLLISGGIFLYSRNHYKEKKVPYFAENDQQKGLRESPYSLEELMDFTEKGNWPNDAITVYENWYSYFSKDTPFVNSNQESINFETYTTLRECLLDDNGTFFRYILNWNTDYGIPNICQK